MTVSRPGIIGTIDEVADSPGKIKNNDQTNVFDIMQIALNRCRIPNFLDLQETGKAIEQHL